MRCLDLFLAPEHDERTDTRFDTQFVLGPNASLSVRGAWVFMAMASAATLGCAAWCAWLGYWPVLPFAGLELAVLGWALAVSMCRNRYREVVCFSGEQVRVEFGVAGQGAQARLEFPRAWTRAWIERDAEGSNTPTRLMVGSSGQRVVVGRCLSDAERETLLKRFNNLLHARPTDIRAATQSGMTLGEG